MHDAIDARARGCMAPVTDGAALDELIARSHREPVVVFNHDPFCGTSAAAREELERLGAHVAVVDVARHHDLGQLVAARTGVRHQSPQAIVLRDGRPAWSASHFGITTAVVRRALGSDWAAAADEGRASREAASAGAVRPWWRLW
jgi:bacillithiol system protein YtxJ